MNDDTAGTGGMPGHVPGSARESSAGKRSGGEPSGGEPSARESQAGESPRDRARLQRRAAFLSELESARRMIARARDADHTVMIRELLGHRPIVRGR